MTSQSPGTPVVGGSSTLTCTVSGADNLGGANIVWTGPRTNAGSVPSLDLTLGTLVLSDAGEYTCTATISSDLLINDLVRTGNTQTITLQSECTNHIAKVCAWHSNSMWYHIQAGYSHLGVLYSWENMTLYLKNNTFCSTNYMG